MIAEQWEHLVVTMFADAKAQEDFLQRMWPDKKFGRFAPQALIPLLDEYGAQGWELVALTPISMRDNGGMLPVGSNLDTDMFGAHQYLCAFKRRKRD